jgi:hypothetical protein
LQFVVDGNWVTDHTAPQENDASGNLNNVLTTERIVKHTPETAGIMSTVGPGATTVGLAKDVPLENKASSDLPGAFPETPAATEEDAFSVKPLPAFEGGVNPIKLAPGEKVPDPSELTSHTITSNVKDDPELVAADQAKETSNAEPTFGVAPLPAFDGAVNPVKVAPGEKLPGQSEVTGHSVTSNVTLDKESYEKSGGLGNAPILPVVTSQSEQDNKGTGILDLPPTSGNLIPESSLPIGGAGVGSYDASPLIQSGGGESTTAKLAGAVPLESTKVPEVVKESQEEAGVSPEASAVPEEVKEKSTVEKQLLSQVSEAPSTSEGTGGKDTADKKQNGFSAGGAAAAVGGVAITAGGAAAAYASGAASKLPEPVSSKLPESVQNSIKPETTPETTAKDTPEVVKESIAESGQGPEAAANETAVLEKKEVEKELLSEVKQENSTGVSAPKLNVPASPHVDSRDVSPGTVPGGRAAETTGPSVTTGVASAPTATTSSAAAATDSAAEKKKKRLSFFGKIKAKLSHKD